MIDGIFITSTANASTVEPYTAASRTPPESRPRPGFGRSTDTAQFSEAALAAANATARESAGTTDHTGQEAHASAPFGHVLPMARRVLSLIWLD